MNDERIEETLDREDIQIASLDKRFFAFIVDALLIATLASIINIETIVQLNTQGFRDTIQALNAIPMLFLQIFALGFFYQGLFTFWYGASLGKMLFKIQVISIDMLDSPSLLRSFTRAFLREFSQVIYYIPFVFAGGDNFKRTLYDRITHTIVISQKR